MSLDLDAFDRDDLARAHRRRSALRPIIGFFGFAMGAGASGVVALAMVWGIDVSTYLPKQLNLSRDFSHVYAGLGIDGVPPGLLTPVVYRSLDKLDREPCDRAAMKAAGDSLVASHEDRLAANMYLGFSRRCSQDPFSERVAAHLFYKLGDYTQSRHYFADLVDRFPQNDNDWYGKGKAEAALKLDDAALDSYAATISLARNQQRLGAWVFEELAAVYAAQGRFCEAMTPIETFVSLDAHARDTSRTRGLLDNYSKKGHCAGTATGSQTFPVLSNDVITVRASINGVTGTFAIDTGASFVALTPEFATRAHVESGGALHAFTANGAADVKMAKAATVGVGRLRAKDIPVVVVGKAMGRLDGLLGRSFLSRFEMTITQTSLSLKTKATG